MQTKKYPLDVKFELSEPLEIAGSDEITVLEMRKPRAKDVNLLVASDKTEYAKMIDLVAVLSGHNRIYIEEMTPGDFESVVQLLTPFLSRSQASEASQEAA